MNHEQSQFCGPPTKEGATLNVPLPQSATLSDMSVNGPIVYECLDSVLRSQVHLLQRNALIGHHPLPPVGEAKESSCAWHMCESTDGWVVCAWLRAWLGVCETGWERMQRRENETNTTSEEIQKLRNETNEVSKGFRNEILPFKREADPQIPERKNFGYEKKKSHRHHKDYIFCLNYC